MSVGKIIINILIASFLLQSCSPARRLNAGESPAGNADAGDFGSLVLNRNISGKGLIISRVRIRYSDDDVSINVSGFIKYNRKEELLVSIRSIAGIEISRVLISKDSLKVHDRLNNTLYIQSLNYMAAKYGIGARDLVLLWGDLPPGIEHVVTEQEGSDKQVFRTSSGGTDYEIGLDKEWNKISSVLLKYGKNNQSKMTFYNFVSDRGLTYPANADILLDRGNITLELKYNGVKRERINSMKFSPTKSAKVIVLQ